MTPSSHRSGAWLAAACAVLLTPPFSAASARATSVTVPDDFPTIQLALDSDADTVRIRDGVYAERPTANRQIQRRVIQGLPASGTRPRMQGLIVVPFQDLFVEGCAFTGLVDLYPGNSLARVTFDSCDLDSGLVHHRDDPADYELIAVLRSRVRGQIRAFAFRPVFEADTLESCGMNFGDEAAPSVTNCIFHGPTDRAIALITPKSASARFIGNSIEGYGIGIAVYQPEGAITIAANNIERCDIGIYLEDVYGSVSGNVILNCGTGVAARISGDRVVIAGNIVLGSSGAGMDFSVESGEEVIVLGNTVGRSGGDGIHIDQNSAPYYTNVAILRGNTSYRNLGAGFLVRHASGTYVLDLRNNIGFENGTYGIDADTSATPDSCNDWHGNHAGATRGVLLSGTDLALDPRFCDVDHDSVTLASNSPLLDAPGCGLIGARGMGCAAVPTLLSLFAADRDADGVRVRWQLAEPTRLSEIWIERADVGAGPWARVMTEESNENAVTVGLDRSASAEREYWYRLAAREGTEVVVISQPVSVQGYLAGRFELTQVTPNPGTSPVTISFTLPRPAEVEVNLIDLQGRHVASLVHGSLAAATHTVEWPGRANTPGIYFVEYHFPGGRETRRVVRLR